jgi:hypothetical protein
VRILVVLLAFFLVFAIRQSAQCSYPQCHAAT